MVRRNNTSLSWIHETYCEPCSTLEEALAFKKESENETAHVVEYYLRKEMEGNERKVVALAKEDVVKFTNDVKEFDGVTKVEVFTQHNDMSAGSMQPSCEKERLIVFDVSHQERDDHTVLIYAKKISDINSLIKLLELEPKEREFAIAKPHHMIAPGSSRYSSNDMVHKHYLEEAKKKTQESSRNSEPSVMPSARSQSTTNGSKPKPRINNQKSRNWHASKSSCVHIIGLKWIPTGKIFTSSTSKVDSEPKNGSNDDITNQYECKQTLDVSAGTSLNPTKEGLRVWLLKTLISEKPGLFNGISIIISNASDHNSSELGITRPQSYALSWKPCQGDSLNLPDHRIHKDGDGDALFHLKSDSLPHAHAQTTKTYYKHRDSKIMKAQELKTKTSAQTLIYKSLQDIKVLSREIVSKAFKMNANIECCHKRQDRKLSTIIVSSTYAVNTNLLFGIARCRLLRENARQLFLDDIYRNPGPLQFDGPGADSRVLSLCVEDLDYMGRIKKLNEYLKKVRAMVKPGCSQDVVKAALSAMSSVTDILSVMSSPSNSTT
ncbi:hypothetical protein Tco_0308289 [Tanacetum coccineum]